MYAQLHGNDKRKRKFKHQEMIDEDPPYSYIAGRFTHRNPTVKYAMNWKYSPFPVVAYLIHGPTVT